MIDFDQLKQLSPPVLIIIAINVLMFGAKRIQVIPDWIIPALAMVLGGVIYPLISNPGDVPYTVRCPLCLQVLFGLIIGFAAVGCHQQVKQLFKRFGISTGDTEVITKDSVTPIPETTKPTP
jgi:hypothetical protein